MSLQKVPEDGGYFRLVEDEKDLDKMGMIINKSYKPLFSIVIFPTTGRGSHTKSNRVNSWDGRNIHSICTILLMMNFRIDLHQGGNRSLAQYTLKNYIKLRVKTSKKIINPVNLFNFGVLYTITNTTLD